MMLLMEIIISWGGPEFNKDGTKMFVIYTTALTFKMMEMMIL